MPRPAMPAPDVTPAPAGPRLGALILASGRSLRAVADSAGVSAGDLSRACRGAIDPRASTIARVLADLGRTWGDLDG